MTTRSMPRRADAGGPSGPRRSARHGALVLALGLAAAGCGQAAGSIDISGSSTVEPISARVAERFSVLHPEVAIKVEGPGTGDGAQLFCTGRIDIAGASRRLKDPEKALCAQNGIRFIELMVAVDGVTVITSLENRTVDCLGSADLYALLGPESQDFANWSDADPLAAEIGAPHAPYPDLELVITAPGEESGTYDTFVGFAIKSLAEDRGQEAALRPDYVASPNDNVIIEGVSGSAGSLGFAGYAFFTENRSRVRALAIDDGDGCVAPSEQTIADGSYPYSRPLFIYVNEEAAASKPEVVAYVDLYLSEVGRASIDDTGYVRLADYAPTVAAWENRSRTP